MFSCSSPLSLSLILFQVIVVEESSQVTCPITTKLVLDEDEETKEPLVQVHRNLVTKLKPHQVDGKDTVNSVTKNQQLNSNIVYVNTQRCSGLMSAFVCLFVYLYFRGSVHVGLLLWICEEDWEVCWFRLHPCSLYGAGKNSAGTEEGAAWKLHQCCAIWEEISNTLNSWDSYLVVSDILVHIYRMYLEFRIWF